MPGFITAYIITIGVLTSSMVRFWLLQTATIRSAALRVVSVISGTTFGSVPLVTAWKNTVVKCRVAAMRGTRSRSFEPVTPLMNFFDWAVT